MIDLPRSGTIVPDLGFYFGDEMGLDAYIFHDNGKGFDQNGCSLHEELAYFRKFYELNDLMAKYSKSEDFNCEHIDLNLKMIDEIIDELDVISQYWEDGGHWDEKTKTLKRVQSFAFGKKMMELGIALEKTRQLIKQGERVYYWAWW